ncbi:kinase-like domain-containing protein [Elsinoe ampelina]|uniref:non-specific serine/threonine protein kinase n=1 Tax=Elsinoe ampelina TaxID=302913 RepID=A0A6A6G069_9PEZI|nr:kinase-like domain-containing protein [Elsinoe ampelina]
MSSFFRPASEISASDDTSTQSLDSSSQIKSTTTKAGELASPDHTHGEFPHELASSSAAPSIASQHYQNVLVHALLEDKCLNDVCHELNNVTLPGSPRYTKDHPHVRSQATERYRALTGQLATHGLVSSGLEGDNFRHVRQTARDGLSLLSQQLNALDLSTEDSSATRSDRHLIRQPLRRLLTEYPQTTISSEHDGSIGDRHISGVASQLLPAHPLLDSTRYMRDFDEVCMLGKGGYGSVFQCNHRLDGRSYAVKKIVLGPTVLKKVQQRGEGELNNILSELRTMARIEHPNIVRYFGGWVEWSRTAAVNQTSSSEQPRLITQGTSDGDSISVSSTFHSHSQQMLSFDTGTGASQVGDILFEHSDSQPQPTSQHVADDASDPPPETELSRTHTRSTLATVTDESNDVEEISRQSAIIETSETGSGQPQQDDQGLSLTLHIQMSLYPLTLSQYLFASTITLEDSQLSLRHCFHLPSSVAIMLAILDGVQHLHAHGIVHRDLKPANIFLKPTICTPVTIPMGSIDPLACAECTSPSPVSPGCMDTKSQQLRMSICVGDFGLVSVLPPNDSGDTTTKEDPEPDRPRQVGTELYRPTQLHPQQAETGQAHVSQDIYALAIIFTELLCRFDTRMERYDVLSRLRKEKQLPGIFLGGSMSKAGTIILRMLAVADGVEDAGCEEVRKWLEDLLK